MKPATRRRAIGAGAGLIAGALLPVRRGSLGAASIVEIRMVSDLEGSKVAFDPIGILLEPGQRVRWHCIANVHTTTAYHPKNAGHSLRIPQSAEPWDSDFLLPGQVFEVTLTVAGVYDYFCSPHEMAGMVGRLVVGSPTGPGSLPFDYFKKRPDASSWLDVPELAQQAFPPIADIMAKRVIHLADLPTAG